MDEREKDIQKLCLGVLEMDVESTGDYGMGGRCPFCLENCYWNSCMNEIQHKPDCIYLIAKDLSTGLKVG